MGDSFFSSVGDSVAVEGASLEELEDEAKDSLEGASLEELEDEAKKSWTAITASIPFL